MAPPSGRLVASSLTERSKKKKKKIDNNRRKKQSLKEICLFSSLSFQFRESFQCGSKDQSEKAFSVDDVSLLNLIGRTLCVTCQISRASGCNDGESFHLRYRERRLNWPLERLPGHGACSVRIHPGHFLTAEVAFFWLHAPLRTGLRLRC